MSKIKKIIGPFNFDIRMTEKQKQRRIIAIVLLVPIVLLVYLYGYITVYCNSYNIMNKDKMIVFDIDKKDNATEITVMNRVYRIEK